MFEPLCAALDAAGIACTRNELLADHCTFRIGGPADIFIKPCDEIQLCRAVAFCKEQGARYYLLGNGSNILFEDAGFRGAVLDLTAMKTGIGMKENIPGEESGVVYCNVTVGAGMKLSTLCNFALNHSCTGLEFAYGIPGSCGGAAFMNAGAYGGEMKDVLVRCTHIDQDGKSGQLAGEDLHLTYRHSAYYDNGCIITGLELRLQPGDPAEIKAKMDDLIGRRREKQPIEYPSAGSTFKRPPGHFAGALIDQCGLRGTSVGGARVSEKHAGFVINTGGATCADVLALCRQCREKVLAETGVELEMEIRVTE